MNRSTLLRAAMRASAGLLASAGVLFGPSPADRGAAPVFADVAVHAGGLVEGRLGAGAPAPDPAVADTGSAAAGGDRDAPATVTTLSAVADAMIAEARPTTSFGREAGREMTEGMKVGADDRADRLPGVVRSLVRFDVSRIPANATIIRARLSLYLVYWRDSSRHPTHRVTAYRVAGAWTETGVTWSNQPAYAEASGDFDVPSSDDQDIFRHYPDWDVTEVVQDWVTGDVPNHGLMLRGNETITMRGFGTREGGADYSPLLEIEYTLEAPTRTPTRTPTRLASTTPRPSETPRPTASRTPTATPTRTATRTATPFATASPTATSTPRKPTVYLPIVAAGAELDLVAPPTGAPSGTATAEPAAPSTTPASTATPAPGAGDIEWVQRARPSMSRGGIGVAADDEGRIYAVGGSTSGGPPRFDPVYSSAVERYDPADFGWRRVGSLLVPRSAIAVAVSQGRVFAIGGLSGSTLFGSSNSEVEAYDAQADAWVRRASLPTSLGGAGAASAADGKIYVFGGIRYSFSIMNPLPSQTILDSVLVYDPARDAWAQRAPMPRAIAFPAVAAARNGRIYVVDGTDNFEYDPRTDRWATRRAMPTEREQLGVAGAPDGLVYAAGGFGADSSALAVVEAYDPARDTWTRRADMLVARGGITLVAGKGSIFAVDGYGVEEGILP